MIWNSFRREVVAELSGGLAVKLVGVGVCYMLLVASADAQWAQKSGAIPGQSPAKQSEHGPHCATPGGDDRPQNPTLQMRIPDVELVDQNGRKVRFYSDLVKGKVVVINFVFTTCTTVCPLQGASFSRLQTLLGDRLGTEFYLISVSIDPATDTPERLKAWGASFGARSAWTLVTGGKPEIDEVVRVFTGEAPNKNDHSLVAFLVNDVRGVRIRAYSLGDAARWAQLIAQVMSGSGSNKAGF